MPNGRRILSPLAVWLCLTASAAAHPILIHAGSLAWSDDTVRLSLTLEQHSLQHESLALGNSIAQSRLACELARSIHVLTEQGETLSTAAFSISADGLTATCDYRVSDEQETLVLLHRPSEALGGISRQFRLAWMQDDPNCARVLRLTSGGNHVVVRKPTTEDASDVHRAPFNEPVLRIIADRDAATQQVILDFPCTLLATWEDLIEIDNDTLTAQAFAQSRDALNAWARSNLAVANPNLTASPITIDRINLIDAAGEPIAETDPAPHSIYTTRVRWHIHASKPARAATAKGDTTKPAWTAWTWTGYNAAVLSLPVIIEGNTYPTRLGVLTSAQATATIEQTTPPRVHIGHAPCTRDNDTQAEARVASTD